MTRFYLSLGSNISPGNNIPQALKLLGRKFDILKQSSIYEANPIGPPDQPVFWNLAILIQSDLPQNEIRQGLKEIEKELGREHNPQDKYAPRPIDIDLLPQTGYQQQAFIMIPLEEIAPEEKDPETGKTYKTLAQALKSDRKNLKKVGPAR
ncbi:MAG: 2-amino-4-hydroxy-6-hydroxymethyldihydropteridine diphosphokinase [Candidatus Omnitrophica bacterium]|nr:2-amino-4-hydroxy-6-hydroxymethyldihydropteridine diphosphokinase [Candidatus Omnitrophota bacterium]